MTDAVPLNGAEHSTGTVSLPCYCNSLYFGTMEVLVLSHCTVLYMPTKTMAHPRSLQSGVTDMGTTASLFSEPPSQRTGMDSIVTAPRTHSPFPPPGFLKETMLSLLVHWAAGRTASTLAYSDDKAWLLFFCVASKTQPGPRRYSTFASLHYKVNVPTLPIPSLVGRQDT